VDGEVRVVIENGVARSAGDTVLGGDDKAAVAVLLALLDELAAAPPPVEVDVVFTVSEEVGLRGAKHLDLGLLRAKVGFVFDSEGPVGTVVMSAPTLTLVGAEFRGKAAHAGFEPERGRSALVAATRAVAAMRLGRLDDETTANIGIIEGGSATNIVAGHCRIAGEARSRDREKLAQTVAEMIGAVNLAAAETGVDVVLTAEEDFAGFSLKRDDLPVRLATEAISMAGVEVRYIGSGGGADTNVFNQRGLPSVTLGVGFENVHSSEETLALERLLDLYAVARGLVQAASRTAS
jgi:tripeptide aminopeptidase